MKVCEICFDPNDGPHIFCKRCRDKTNGVKARKLKAPRKRVSIRLLRQRVERLQKAIDGIRRLIDDPQ